MNIIEEVNDEQVLELALEVIIHSDKESSIRSAENILMNYIMDKDVSPKFDESPLEEEEILDILTSRSGLLIADYALEHLIRKGWADTPEDDLDQYVMTKEGTEFMTRLFIKRNISNTN